jgi:itaconate CoA-transferase
MPSPLSNTVVVALEQAASAPLASRHLADLGATVIKVERPGKGDFARLYDSSVNGTSSYFAWANRGKLSITIDIKKPDGRKVLETLLDKADVFLTNLSQAALERADLTPEFVRSSRPELIYCSVSGYGSNGPYRDRKAYDLLIQGESGLALTSGTPDEPSKIGISICDIASGIYSTVSILAALIQREREEFGTEIDISMFECSVELMGAPLYFFLGRGEKWLRAGMRHSLIVPYGPFLSKDNRYINFAVQNNDEWKRFCTQVLEKPELVDEPRFKTNEDRMENRKTLELLIQSHISGMSRGDVIKLLDKARVGWGDINDVDDLLNHPQLNARKRWESVNVNQNSFRMLRHPMNILGLPSSLNEVPSLGQHTEEILRSIGYDDSAILSLKRSGVIELAEEE